MEPKDAARKTIQDVLDVVAPYFLKGKDFFCRLDALLELPDLRELPNLRPLIDIARVCSPEDRPLLMVRSGACCRPLGRHAGEKEATNAAAVKEAVLAPIVPLTPPASQESHSFALAPLPKMHKKTLVQGIVGLLTMASKVGLNSCDLREKLKVPNRYSYRVQWVLRRLRAQSFIDRRRISPITERGPQYTYFILAKAGGVGR